MSALNNFFSRDQRNSITAYSKAVVGVLSPKTWTIFCFDGMMPNEMSPYDYPLRAGDWGNENKTIRGWKIVKRPQRGDIGAFKANYVDASGHMGIMRNSQSLVYANKTHIASSPTTVSEWATKQWIYRRYVGGK